MDFIEVQKQIIDCILNGVTLWGDICKLININPAIITLACIKLEQEMVIINQHCNYSLFLYSGEML